MIQFIETGVRRGLSQRLQKLLLPPGAGGF
jgi:hypothetical protein